MMAIPSAALSALLLLFMSAATALAQSCSINDAIGAYDSSYGRIECTASGNSLDCCYDSNCRYDLDLQLSTDGSEFTGRWDHKTGRSGSARFGIDATCGLDDGFWGEGDADATRRWPVNGRLTGGTAPTSSSGAECKTADLAGAYSSRYGEIQCLDTGSSLACCYGSSCRYDLELAVADGGRTLSGSWDHKTGRTGTVQFRIEPGCSIGDGAWGEGTAMPTTGWSVGDKRVDFSPSAMLADRASGPLPGIDTNPPELPGDQFDPQQLPGDQFDTQQLPGDQFDPQQLPGDQFDTQQLPGDQFDPQQLPGDQFDTQQLPGDQFDPQELPGDQFGQESLPGGDLPTSAGGFEAGSPNEATTDVVLATRAEGTLLQITYASEEEALAAAEQRDREAYQEELAQQQNELTASQQGAAGNTTQQQALLPSSGFYPTGTETVTEYSGMLFGISERIDGFPEGGFISRIYWEELLDRPCRMAADRGTSAKFGNCGNQRYDHRVALSEDTPIYAVQVCNNRNNARYRLKGLRIWGRQFNADGTSREAYVADQEELPNCTDWAPRRECPENQVASGLVVIAREGNNDNHGITGLRLICHSVAVR